MSAARRSLGVVLALALCAGIACSIDLGSLTRTSPLEEKVILGRGGPKVALIDVQGVISAAESSSALGVRRPSLLASVREALDLAREDDDVAALLLRIHSPGGTVAASETLHHEIAVWKRETGRPVVAYFEGFATSGGYYAAMAADEVIAHPTSVTGSIGVVMMGLNVTQLMERFGVENQTFTSGEFKDSGSPLRPMRDEERAHLESVIDDLHARFVEVVIDGRPGLSRETVASLSDGRIFTARQALERGLIDGVSHLDDVLESVETRIGASRSRLVVYARRGEFRETIHSGAPARSEPLVELDLLPPWAGRAEPGFYYIWPAAFGR